MIGHRFRYLWAFLLIITGLGVPLGSALAWPVNPESPLTAPANQLPAYRVSFTAYSYIATEEVGQVVITVTVDPPAPNVVQVNYSMADDTAQAGQDYEPVGGTLQIPPHTAFATYTIPITDDDLTEFDETATLYLSFAFGAQLWPPAVAGLIIPARAKTEFWHGIASQTLFGVHRNELSTAKAFPNGIEVKIFAYLPIGRSVSWFAC